MSAPTIAPVGLTSGEVLPGIYMETNFAQGAALGSGLVRAILVLANKTSDGSAIPDTQIYGPDTPIPLQSNSDMIALGGPGSEAHRMFLRMAAVSGGQNGPAIYWLFVAESAGAQATGTIPIANNATAPATFRLYVGDDFVDTGINIGDTPDDVAAAVVANVAAKTEWPVTASAAAGGTISLTAKQKGLRGNWIRYQATIMAQTPPTMTTLATVDAFMTGGTVSDSNAAALVTIASRWFYYIVSAAEDQSQVEALASQVSTQALAINGIRQRVLYGSIDTTAKTNAINVSINNARAECVALEKSNWTPAELAANQAVVYALEEASELGFRTNFIGYGNDDTTQKMWKVPAPRDVSAWPTPATLRSLLQNGATAIGVNPNGTTYVVDRFTTRSLNGSQPDPRIREGHKVTITDRFADALKARLVAGGAGKVIGDDPPNNGIPPPGMLTPRLTRMMVFQTIDEFYDNSKIQNPDDIKATTIVQREANPTSRMGIKVPLQTIDNFRQAAVIINQVA